MEGKGEFVFMKLGAFVKMFHHNSEPRGHSLYRLSRGHGMSG